MEEFVSRLVMLFTVVMLIFGVVTMARMLGAPIIRVMSKIPWTVTTNSRVWGPRQTFMPVYLFILVMISPLLLFFAIYSLCKGRLSDAAIQFAMGAAGAWF